MAASTEAASPLRQRVWQRSWRASTAWAALAALTLAVGVVPGGAVTSANAAGRPSLDSRLRLEPYLQYGAQVEPARRVRVIVQKTGPQVSSQAIAQAVGASPQDEFPLINALTVEVPQQAAVQLARQPGVRYVTYDGPVVPNAIDTSYMKANYAQAIGVTQLWNAAPAATGSGITVAVLDSGVASHPDINTNTIAVNVNKAALGNGDGNGHGTHVIGTIKGRDSQGRYIGIAPDARVISVKIADDTGASTESDLIRGLQWVYDNRATYSIRAVNLSVSGSVASSYVTNAIDAAAEQLWRAGVVVIAASGNRGAVADATWYAPGNDPFVITVGALDHSQTIATSDDTLATFSSRGPTQDGFAKPEVIAPGRQIVAPLASASVTLAKQFPTRIVDSNYLRLSGTSMASPVVTGAVALLLQRFPTLTPDQVKALLQQTANTYSGQADKAGVIDLPEIIQFLASGGTPGVANTGIALNTGIDPATGQVTWGSAYWDSAYWDSAYWDASTYQFFAAD